VVWRTGRWPPDVPPAGVLHHQQSMPMRQTVTGRSLYLHAHTVVVEKCLLIRGFLKSGLLTAWKMQSQGLVI
jgi:hypothetical protein